MRTKVLLALPIVLCGFIAAEDATAGDLAKGREKAKACAVCHGALGLAEVPNAPNLAGENKRYIVAQLKAYRSGKRKHSQMSFIAKDLSDTDMKDLAEWFSAIKVTVEAPVIE